MKRSACLFLALVLSSLLAGPASADDAGLGEVAALVTRHRDAQALAALERIPLHTAPAGRYLAGRLLERLGRHSEAADAYAQAVDLPPEVTADARSRRAFALARAGRCVEAEPLLVAEGARRGSEAALARALRAECALDGDPVAAVALLRAVVREAAGPVDLFTARLELATALEAAGQAEEATQQLLLALEDRPGHPERQAAIVRLTALGGQLPAPTPAAAPVARSRAETLHLEGMALYARRGHYDEAARVLARAAALGGPTAVDDAFHAARARSRAGDNRRAIRDYKRLIRRHRDHPRAAEASYLAALLALSEGGARPERGLVRFIASPYAERRPGDARAAHWLVGFHAFEAGRYAEARRYLEKYGARSEAPLEVARAAYWIGRSAEAQGERDDALGAYTRALHHEPLGWYAQLAHQRLEGLGVALPPFASAVAAVGAVAAAAVVVAGGAADAAATAPAQAPVAYSVPPAVALYRSLGLIDDALDALRAAEDALRDAAPAGQELDAVLAAYAGFDAVSRPYRLAAAAGGRFAEPPGPTNALLWRAAYPRPYGALVDAAAARYGVPAEHVYATMRQESAFDPEARSGAGAEGLLQLMPGTATRVAQGLGLPFELDSLREPAVNIELGVAEMAALFERWDSHLPLVIASYNAGTRRVEQWVKARRGMETDRFVEHIPFNETRNYVRRVVGHFGRYRYLAHPDEPWTVPIPKLVEPVVVSR